MSALGVPSRSHAQTNRMGIRSAGFLKLLEAESTTCIYSPDGDTITLHSAGGYNQNVGSDGRAMTIAAFRVAQNSTGLTGASMRRDIVTFLHSPRAVSYWVEKKWLERAGAASDGANLVRLTVSGRSECDMSLRGSAALTTDELAVSRWVKRMLTGDRNSMKSKTFPLQR